MKLDIRIHHKENGRFVACCPSLPGCSACGDSHEQAAKKLELAIRGYLASLNVNVPEEFQSNLVPA